MGISSSLREKSRGLLLWPPSVLPASSSVVGRAATLRSATGAVDEPAYYSRGRPRSAGYVHPAEPEKTRPQADDRSHAVRNPSRHVCRRDPQSRPEPAAPSPGLLDELTAREREVVALVGNGLGNDEIAERLVVSPATAKTHVSRAMVKLKAHNRARLVVFAYETGLVRARTDTAGLTSRRLAIA
jgi:DNA-binding CsgD family transcriptional regulator